jgi:hypothetical protein
MHHLTSYKNPDVIKLQTVGPIRSESADITRELWVITDFGAGRSDLIF